MLQMKFAGRNNLRKEKYSHKVKSNSYKKIIPNSPFSIFLCISLFLGNYDEKRNRNLNSQSKAHQKYINMETK